jgi:uncharacterized membrane protein
MNRGKFQDGETNVHNGFRWRGTGEVSRIEALSDGVIAFAVTLLVVSLEVPRTFDQLLVTMRGFVAFAITFFMLFHVWFVQYKFFRRYGLNDNFTIWANAFLLFVVLFYVYPLKFVWTLTVNMMMGLPVDRLTPDGSIEPPIRREQVPQMMAIFGLGFAAVFTVFTLLYHHAYRKRAELEMNDLEIHDTRTQMQDNACNVLIGLLSILVAYVTRSGLAGLVYWLIGPVQFFNGWLMGKRRKRLEARLAAEAGGTSVGVERAKHSD